jgi:D-alanyl-D-alanine carboxypeptidase/D-alanyl-D-alanine-endopeptidase (penicillin-binding protein 4)
VSVIPELGHLIVLNYATTVPGAESHLTWTRSGTSNEWLVTGTVGQLAPPQMQDVAVQDSALFAADALRHELQLRGIAILGRIRARHRDLSSVPDPLHTPFAVDTTGTELAAIDSAPLSSAIQVINKTSQNLHAEMLLRELGWNLRHTGTLAAGLDERKSFLAGAGVPDTGYAFVDGSGLGRQGLTTPQSTVALLRYMWQRPERDVWFASLPVGGFDGTLQKRFKGIAGADRVHAKTGSLAHVAALAGYLQTKRGHWIVFCVMLNAQTAHLPEAQSFLDHLCAIFLDS